MKEAEVVHLDTDKPEQRVKGKIVKLDKENGWGFIVSPELRFKRIYFHWSALSPTLDFIKLSIGDMLTFTPTEYTDPKTNEYKGWRAYKIELG